MTIAEFCPRNVTHGGRTASPRAYKCMLISVSAWHFRKIISRKQVENTRPIYVNLIHFFVILIYSFVEPFKQRWADVDGYSLYSSPFQTNSPSAFWVRLFTWLSALVPLHFVFRALAKRQRHCRWSLDCVACRLWPTMMTCCNKLQG